MTPDLIQSEHDRLGYELGWRFMTGPAANLTTSPLAIVGLNPGGHAPHGPSWSQEAGNSYIVESWRGAAPGSKPLQRQIQRMLELLRVEDPNSVFTAQFVPFRSPRWADLDRKAEALAFADRLWRWTLDQSPAETIICIGQQVTALQLSRLLSARPVASVPASWGSCKIDVFVAAGRRIIALPHLGTFKLFNRTESEDAFIRALEHGSPRSSRILSPPVLLAQAPQPTSPLSTAHRSARSTPSTREPTSATGAAATPRLRRAGKRPDPETVWGLVVDAVGLTGCTDAELTERLARIPRSRLPAAVLRNPSKQVPGSTAWWRGYINGSLRRGFIERS